MLSGFPKNESIDGSISAIRKCLISAISLWLYSPIITWPDFDDPQVAPFRRSRSALYHDQ